MFENIKINLLLGICIAVICLLCACQSSDVTAYDNQASEVSKDETDVINPELLNMLNEVDFYSSNLKKKYPQGFGTAFYYEIINPDKITNLDEIIKLEDRLDKIYTEFVFQKVELPIVDMYFDENIAEESRRKFAEENYSTIEYMVDRYDLTDRLKIYITDSLNSAVIDGEIYIRYNENMKVEEVIENVLLGIYGETSNYGLIYGEIKDVENNLPSYEDDSFVMDETTYIKALEANPEYADLLYPVFSIEFSEEVTDRNTVKKLAVDFSEYIKEEYGNEEYLALLEESSEFDISFDEKYVSYMNEFLDKNNIEVEISVPFTPIRSSKMIGDSFDIKISTEWVDYIFERGYVDETLVTQHTYPDIKKYILQSEEDAEKMRDYFAEKIDRESYVKPLACFSNDMVNSGICFRQSNIIIVRHTFVFIHEFTHYLYPLEASYRDYYNENKLFSEGRAEYTKCMFDSAFSYICPTNFARFICGYMSGKTDEFRKAFEKYRKSNRKSKKITTYDGRIFRDVDMRFYYMELAVYFEYINYGWEDDSMFYKYIYGPVLTKYLIDNYGLEEYEAVYKDVDKFEDTYDMTLTQMEEEIMIYLENKFGEFINS